MAHVHFFLTITERGSEALPEILELPPTPQVPADTCLHDPQRPLMSRPFVLGRGSPCLLWALHNTLACSRRLLDFTTWTFPPTGTTASPSHSSSLRGPTAAHPSAHRHGVRVSCKDRNRMVRLHRHGQWQSTTHSSDGNPCGFGEGGATWLRVGDALTIADQVTLRLGALVLVTVPEEEACPDVDSHRNAAEGETPPFRPSSGPVYWFAGSDMGSSGASSADSSGSAAAAMGSSHAGLPSLPRVGMRPSVTWGRLQKPTRLEMMLTCWFKWSSALKAPVPSSASLAPSRSPFPASTSPSRTAAPIGTVVTISERGVQTSPTLLRRYPFASLMGDADNGPDRMVVAGTAPPQAAPSIASSRSSATAGDATRDDGATMQEVDEAATPSHSQVRVLKATGEEAEEDRTRGREPVRSQAGASQNGGAPSSQHPPLPGQRSSSSSSSSSGHPSSPPSFLTAQSRQQPSGVLARPYSLAGNSVGSTATTHGDNSTGHNSSGRGGGPLREQQQQQQQQREEPQTGDGEANGSGSHDTCGETYDAHLDDALAALEQQAFRVEPLTPRSAVLLGEEESEEHESADANLTARAAQAAGPRLRSRHPGGSAVDGGRRSGKQPPRQDGPGARGRRSSSGTPHRTKKRPRPQEAPAGEAADEHSLHRSFRELGVPPGATRGLRRSLSGLAMSGLPTRPQSTHNGDSTGSGSNKVGNAAAIDPRVADESQEVFFQHR